MVVTTSEAAAVMGRKGGKVNTPKGFAALTPAQRSEVGKAAATKRWASKNIYCYVTGEQCLLKTAGVNDEVFGRPVSECGDYEAWKLDQDETNALVFSASGYGRRAARAVQEKMGWQVNLYPIRKRLMMELARIIQRNNEKFSAAEVVGWIDSSVDEDDVARRNDFQPVRIAEDMAKCYTDEQEVAA